MIDETHQDIASLVHVEMDTYTHYIPALEREFCSNFACCGRSLSDLHELVDHFEEAHTLVPNAPGKIYLHTLPTSPASSLSSTSSLSSLSSDGGDHSVGSPFDPCHVFDGAAVPHVELTGECDAASDTACSPTTHSHERSSGSPVAVSTAKSHTLDSTDLLPSSGDVMPHPCGVDGISSGLLSSSSRHEELCLPPWLCSGGSVGRSHHSGIQPRDNRHHDHHGPCPPRQRDHHQQHHHQQQRHESEGQQQSAGTVAPRPSSRGEDRRRQRTRARMRVVVPRDRRDGLLRCPTPGCTKTYLHPNGLKYHLEKGTCSFDPSDRSSGREQTHDDDSVSPADRMSV